MEFAYELSVVVARDKNGDIIIGAVPKNFQDNGVLVTSVISEDMIPEEVRDKAITHAINAANGMNYEGVLVVEFFIGKDGTVRANEMAPRPHNSGHHTIEAMYTSQYDLQNLLAHGTSTVASILESGIQ